MKKRMLQRLLSGILVFSIIMGTRQHLVLASEIQGQISDENALDSVEEDSQDNSAEESTQSILPEETEEESQAEQLPSEETEEEEVLQEEAEEDLEPASSVSEKEIAAWEEKQLSQGFLDLGPDHLDAQNGVSTAAEGIENADTGSASFSQINNLLVLVRFQDQTDDYMNAQNSARLDATYNSTSMMGSMKDYVEAMSYGELTVDTAIFPRSESTLYCSVQVDHTIDYYLTYSETPVITDNTERGYLTSSDRFAREKALCDEILRKVKAEIESELTEAQLDENGDGYIDSISFAFDTIAADAKGRIQYADLLWPHKTSYASPVTIHGIYMSSYNFLSRGTDNVGMMGSTRQVTSTAVHEFMHTLGLPDLYHYTKSGSPVGGWDVMSSTASPTPQLLNAYYQREYMQWGDPLETISSSQNITLTAPGFSDGSEKYAVKLVSPYNTKEFFVAEFRNLEGYDRVLPAADSGYTPGLLVYRIVEEDAANNVYVRQGNRTGEDAMYVFRPSETGINACKGSIANAALNGTKADWAWIGKEAGTEGNGFDANILSFYNGDNSGIVIKNVIQNGDTISFDVEIPALLGSGTIQDPYQITRPADLRMFNDSEGKYFRLMNDLDLQGYEHNVISCFQGTFDGNGKTIRNLSVTTNEDAGLFQSIGVNGTVKNLNLESVQITGEGSVGAVAGAVSGTIQNVEVRSGAVICTSGIQKTVGGIAGYVDASGKVTDCVSYASVTGEEAGGIAGRICDGYIADCYVAGTVNGTGSSPKAGGIFGIYYVSDSYKEPVNLYWDVEGTGQDIVGNGDNSFNDGTAQYPGNVGIGIKTTVPEKLEAGNTAALSVDLTPAGSSMNYTWKSGNAQIAEVMQNRVTAKAKGNALIVFSFVCGTHICELENTITISEPVPRVTVKDKDGTMTNYILTGSGISDAKGIRFAVWSEEDGQDDLRWYDALKDSQGNWVSEVNISAHRTAGKYQVHMYTAQTGGIDKFLRGTTFTVSNPTLSGLTGENINSLQGIFTVRAVGAVAASGVEKIEVAVWSQNNQKDLKWYTLGSDNNGNYQCQVNIKSHNYNYGTYQVHAYLTTKTGITRCVRSTSVRIPIPESNLTARGNSGETIYRITGENVSYYGGIKGVKFAVWSEAGGQDDLRWYQAVKDGNGNWIYDVKISDHKTAGRYQVHMYVILADGTEKILRSTTFSVSNPSLSGFAAVNIDSKKGTFTVIASGAVPAAGIEKVEVAVWSQKDQKDLKWYTLIRDGEGNYTGRIDIRNHNYNYGNYTVHGYVTSQTGIRNCAMALTVNMRLPTVELTAVGNSSQMSYRVTGTDPEFAGGVKRVRYAVWSEENGQDDLKWYRAVRDSEGNWIYDVNIADHKTAGAYQVHMYLELINGTERIVGSTTFWVEAPFMTELESADVNAAGGMFTVAASGLSSVSGIEKVEVAVWNEKNQSDLKWYTLSKDAQGKYVCQINIKNHNYNYGIYQVHAYITTKTGIRQCVRSMNVNVPRPQSKLIAELNSDQTVCRITGSDVVYAGGVKGVKFAVWSEEEGQDDLRWYQAVQNSEEEWIYDVNISDHRTAGEYLVHMYAVLTDGTEKILSAAYFYVDRPVVGIRIDSCAPQGTYEADIAISGSYGNEYRKIELLIWSSENGQDDLKTIFANKKGTRWSAIVDVRNPISTGMYCVHVYGKLDNGKSELLGTSSFYVEDEEKARNWKPNLKEQEITVPGLEREYTFLFVTDSHMICIDDSDTEKIRTFGAERRMGFVNSEGLSSTEQFIKYIETANEKQADGFLMGGDIIDFPSQNNIELLRKFLENLNCEYLYTTGNHDWTYPWEYMTDYSRTTYRPMLNEFVKQGMLEGQILEYEDLIVCAVDNSSNQVDPQAIPIVKNALSMGKPVIMLMHVPLQSETLLRKAEEKWGTPIVLGDQGIKPNSTTKEFLDLIFAENSPVIAVLDGHVHLHDISMLENGVIQYTGDLAAWGNAILLKVKGEN